MATYKPRKTLSIRMVTSIHPLGEGWLILIPYLRYIYRVSTNQCLPVQSLDRDQVTV